MARTFTRRQLLLLGGGIVTAEVCGAMALVEWKSSRAEGEAQRIRSAIYDQISRAGWRGAKPNIFMAKDQKNVYVTGPLGIAGGCHVALAFDGNNSMSYKVHYYTTRDTDEYILQVTGLDGKKYPDALVALRNPTKSQIDQILTRAGLTHCKPIGG